MCGLTGIFDLNCNIASPDLSLRMIKKLNHRGPDNIGHWNKVSDGIFLSHSRLSIIDLSKNGHQPMSSFSERWVISFNGEIYNYRELRKSLEPYNIFFRGNSDTEVLLNSFEIFGVKSTLRNIDGMFAIALWDNLKKSLFLIRDRAGEKPLYYYMKNHVLYFASELKALKEIPNFDKKISKKALNFYFKLGFIPSNECIYENVKKILPGQYIMMNKKSKSLEIKKYWNIEDYLDQKSKFNIDEETDFIDNLLDSSVKNRLHSDVKIGTLLSGGIDSSLISYYAQKNSLKKINTFSVGFFDPNYDESVRAKKISDYLGTNHHEIKVNLMDVKNLLPQLANIFCEPLADSSQIPTYLISKKISNHLKVALSGDGGDELFAGYNRHIYYEILNLIYLLPKSVRSILFRSNRNLFANIISKIYSRITSENFHISQQKIYKFLNILNKTNNKLNYVDILSNSHFNELLNKDLNYKICLGNNFFKKNDLKNILSNDFKFYLPDDILTKVDRASMANSIEIRSPFLSKQIIEHSFSIKNKLKVNSFKGKYILRNLMDKKFNEKFSNYPKKGFAIPLKKWMKEDLKDFFEQNLLDKNKSLDFLNHKSINTLWSNFNEDKYDYSEQIWSIVLFKNWYENQ